MTEPRSIRFDAKVIERLQHWATARPGMSTSSAANQLVDEALRTEEHPGIVFRHGPMGRRAALASGPDVWEIIKVLEEIRAAQPEVRGNDLVTATATELGLGENKVRVALHYYGNYPGEIDVLIETAEEASQAAEAAWRVEQRLLA